MFIIASVYVLYLFYFTTDVHISCKETVLFCFVFGGLFFFLCQAVHYLNLLAWDHFDFKTAEQLLIIDVRY